MLRLVLKSLLWLSLLLWLLPADPEGKGVGLSEVSTAFRQVAADLAGFCGRRVETCDIATRFGQSLARKIVTLGGSLRDFAGERRDEGKAPEAAPPHDG